MLNTLPNQTLALAGLAQVAFLVQQIARRGQADEAPMTASLASLFKLNPESAVDVYGGLDGVQLGLRQLLKQLGGPRMDPEQASYAATLLVLERRFMADASMVDAVRQGIERITPLAFPATDADKSPAPLLNDKVVAELAALYQQTVSTLVPKVMVGGEPTYLRQERNTDHIRALLLAGLRSAVLWRQCGGNRWRLFFQRARIVETARMLLDV